MSEEKRRLMLWGVGHESGRAERRVKDGVTVALLEDGAHLPDLVARGVLAAGSTAFVPDGTPPVTGPTVIHHHGSAATGGEELSLGTDFYLQCQGYGVSQYMSVIGPTLVRLESSDDLEVFLSDADTARTTGQFPMFLTNPLVHLADTPALGGSVSTAGPRHRVHVRADAAISTSPTGAVLGRVGDCLGDLEGAWERHNAASTHPCAVALGAVIQEETRVTAIDQRPWIGHYLNALSTLRECHARGITGARVSGFGGRLSTGIPDQHADAAWTVAWTDDFALLRDPGSNRSFQMSRTMGELVDLLLAVGSVEAAAEQRPESLLRELEAQLALRGIVLGEPVDNRS